MSVKILVGDCRDVLKTLPDESVQCVVTSPPYYGLRDYGEDEQIGLEPTPNEYVAQMVEVFREVRRVLRDDGVVWLNLGDSYNSSSQNNHGKGGLHENPHLAPKNGWAGHRPMVPDLKPKDLIGIPWRVAFALQADGWWLRSDVIWHKTNPMPESVTDRPTRAHEYVFLLTKAARYYYDAEAVAEDAEVRDYATWEQRKANGEPMRRGFNVSMRPGNVAGLAPKATGRNRRTVWTISTKPYSGAHFAVMPPDLAEVCIKAGSAEGDMVLDPFGGAGTTALVADRLNRDAIIIELNSGYAELARQRIVGEIPMFADVELVA